jgi:hypothetical protein
MEVKSVKSIKADTSKPKASHRRAYFTKAAMVRVAAVAALFSLISCSTGSPPPPSESKSMVAYKEGVPGGVMVKTFDVSARVTAVDHFNREVTLLGSDGEKFTVKVGPDAGNFDQIQVGDLVNATIAEQLVVHLADKNEASIGGSAGIYTLGAQAGGLAAETRETIGTVTKIDREKRTATLRFQDGSTRTFPVRSDIDLSKHKVGEQVVFRITKMIAIRIEKP